MNESTSTLPVALGKRNDVIDDAVVNVTISFPPIAVPVAELENWRRNVVLEIDCRLAEVQLSVSAGEREVAKGYLVARIEDRVGLILSRILPATA